jgi:hypothetical protein
VAEQDMKSDGGRRPPADTGAASALKAGVCLGITNPLGRAMAALDEKPQKGEAKTVRSLSRLRRPLFAQGLFFLGVG